MQRTGKIIVLFIILMFILCETTVFALSDFLDKPQEFLDVGVSQSDGDGDGVVQLSDDTKTTIGFLLDFLWAMGMLAVFATTAILGIRYMMALPSERSHIKEVSLPYIIGVVVIFGALSIWKLLVNMMEGLL